MNFKRRLRPPLRRSPRRVWRLLEPISTIFIAAALNQETRRGGKKSSAGKKTAPAQTQPFYGLFVRTSAVCIDDGLSLEQAVGFQGIDQVFFRQHPIFEGQCVIGQLVTI